MTGGMAPPDTPPCGYCRGKGRVKGEHGNWYDCARCAGTGHA